MWMTESFSSTLDCSEVILVCVCVCVCVLVSGEWWMS